MNDINQLNNKVMKTTEEARQQKVMSKAKYFTVNETSPDDSDFGHVGTIKAESADELRLKLIEAITSHLDEDVEVGEIDWENLTGGYPVEISFNAFHFLSGSVDVRETWLY